ncbi:MAG TPA: M56 family metallopeptidase, partial [Pyrinomonadaceae bacterium]|nr:M56 family metallopeptidase [Pyrinomonadaceae bacterium]
IRRHDYLVNLLQTAVETLLFYHPAVWWVSREIRMEREHACDDLAVAACGDVLMYARTLAELEEMRASAAPQLAVAANGGSLLARVRRLLETPSQSPHRPTAWLASVIALIAVFSVWASAHTRLRAGDVASAAIERLREAYLSTEKNPASAGCPAHAAANHAGDAALTITDPRPIRVDIRADGAVSPQAEIADAAAAASQQPGESITPPTPLATQAPQTPEAPQTPPATPAPDAPDTSEPPDDDNTPRARQSQSAHMDYIDELAALGLTNLTIDQLIEMKSHGVTSDFIRGLRGAGYNVTKPSTLIALRDHGVTAAYVKEMSSLGFNNLSLEALIA